MNIITKSVVKFAGRSALILKTHSPSILFGTGIVGFVGTVALSGRATLRFGDVLDNTKYNRDLVKRRLSDDNDPEYTQETYDKDIRAIYKKATVETLSLYAPVVLVGVATVGCFTGSHYVLQRRNAALMAAYKAVDSAFARYRENVRNEFGQEKDDELRYGYEYKELAKDTETGPVVEYVKHVNTSNAPSMYAKYFDESCSSWSRQPEYNYIFLRCAQNYANDMLKARGHIFLNEVYDILGLERMRYGAVVGWILGSDGDNYVDFGIFNGDNPRARDFVNGREGSILLDFNVNGVIYDRLGS
jgi:hypothetical protein